MRGEFNWRTDLSKSNLKDILYFNALLERDNLKADYDRISDRIKRNQSATAELDSIVEAYRDLDLIAQNVKPYMLEDSFYELERKLRSLSKEELHMISHVILCLRVGSEKGRVLWVDSFTSKIKRYEGQ